MSTWAVCSFLPHQRETHTPEEVCNGNEGATVKAPLGWSKERKIALGRKVKVLLEKARVEFLRARGFDVKLFYYVPPEVSPENLLIVAKSRE